MTPAAPRELQVLLDEAAQLAVVDPVGAARRLAAAAAMGAAAGADALAPAYEAVGRIAMTTGDFALASRAFELARDDAGLRGDAACIARCRAALGVLARPRPFLDSADAVAAEVRLATDLFDALLDDAEPRRSLHAERTRLDLRRLLPCRDGTLPALALLERRLGLRADDMAVLMACVTLELDEGLDHLLPPVVASWPALLARWVGGAFAAPVLADACLRDLIAHGLLVAADDGGPPALGDEVETLLSGRRTPAIPRGLRSLAEPPRWDDHVTAPSAPATAGPIGGLARVTILTGSPSSCRQLAAQLASAHRWTLLSARPDDEPPARLLTAVAALCREALMFEGVPCLALDGVDPSLARLLIGRTAERVPRCLVTCEHAPPLPDGLTFDVITAPPSPPLATRTRHGT